MSFVTDLESFVSKLKSRKLWATVGAIGLATYELHTGHLSSSDWVSVLKIVLPVWLVGQAVVDGLARRLIATAGPKPKVDGE
jgi:hypothetical protein